MMNKLVVLLVGALLATLFADIALAEEKEMEVGRWYNSVEGGINLTQSAYSDNWRGGENNSVAWTAFINGSARKQFEGGINWTNILKLRFGQTHQQSERSDGSRGWERPEKNEDKIDFETLGLLTKGWKVDPYLSARFESQFLDQSDPNNRDLTLNPMTFKESAGVAYHVIEGEEEFLLTRFGWTQRQNRRKSFVAPTGRATVSNTAHDGGAEFQADWRLKILEEKVAWGAKFSLYQPFSWSESSTFDSINADSLVAAGIDADVKDFSTVLNAVWENTFTTQVTKWISFSLYAEFRYEKYDNSVVPLLNDAGDNLKNAGDVRNAIRKSVQWKQTFGVGITYTFM